MGEPIHASSLFSDPQHQARGYVSWLGGVGGYYYTAFVHEYKKLTENEVQYIDKLLLSDVKEYHHTKEKGYYLEENSVSYGNCSKLVTYYVKLSFITKGKASISVQQVGTHYNAMLVYATRSKYGADAGRPNTFREREPNLSFWKDPTKEKVKRRYKNRKLRKKYKIHDNDTRFNKIKTLDDRQSSKTRKRGRRR